MRHRYVVDKPLSLTSGTKDRIHAGPWTPGERETSRAPSRATLARRPQRRLASLLTAVNYRSLDNVIVMVLACVMCCGKAPRRPQAHAGGA